jgi:C-terminal processing protease CtpA/Prc
MRHKRLCASVAILAVLSSCGGGGGSGGGDGGGDGGGIVVPPGTTPPPPPPPATAVCSVRDRQDWALGQLKEFYLYPSLLATNVNPDSYTTVQAYLDALVAPARAQNRDRFFTSISSLAQDEAFLNSGANAGFGVRLTTDVAAGQVFVAEAFEGSPALAANLDRGTEILAIGSNASDLRTVGAIIAAEGAGGVINALGPATAGLTRLLRVRDAGGATREVTLAKTVFTLDPVSNRYGALVLNDGGKRVGYVNFRSFLGGPAEADLRSAFAQFRAAGISEVIVDLRYNGGGLISTAVLLTNLLLGQRSSSDVQTISVRKAGEVITRFSPQPQSISATRIAFIATGSTASASEVVMNSVLPYLGANAALIGSNTFGKPVGQFFRDRPVCDDRLRVVAFETQNVNRQADYFSGIAAKFQSTCRAADDVTRPLGDPQEASIRTALDFLAGRQCTPIGGSASAESPGAGAGKQELLNPAKPSAVQRELPGAF